MGQSLISGMDYWNGLLEWPTGIFDLKFKHKTSLLSHSARLQEGGGKQLNACSHTVVYNHWTGMVEWNGGMEQWNVFYRVKGHC